MTMERQQAFELVKGHLGESPTLHHCLAVEACMRALAAKFDEDVETWGITGLVHDLDLEQVQGNLENHALVGAQILRDNGFDDKIVNAVMGHNKVDPMSRTKIRRV